MSILFIRGYNSMNLITNFGKKVAQIAIDFISGSDFISGFIFSIFFFLFPGVILSMHPNYKKSFYNSIIAACFMLSLFLNLVLLENFRSLKPNLLNAIFILSILYVLALKKSKEPLPEPDSKLLELVSKLLKPDSKLLEPVSKLISCLNINVPISVIIIIGLFNYCLVYCFAHFVAVIIIIIIVIIIIITLIYYILKKSSLLILLEAVAPIIYFVQLFIISIISTIFLYDFIKLTKINGITVNKLIIQIIQIIVDKHKPIPIIFLLFSFIVVSSVNYSIVYIVYKCNIADKFNIEDKLKK